MMTKVRIVKSPTSSFYYIEKRVLLFFWRYEATAYTLDDAYKTAEIVLNPVIKEFK